MAADEQIDRLSRQLSKQSLGPISVISNQILSGIGSMSASIVGWLRQSGKDQPLITLLLACQAGYLLGRRGRHYAGR